MKNNKLISLILALLVCFSLVVTVSAATDNQNLALAVEANTSTLVQGETFKVSVMTNENPGFLCVNYQILWDTSVLEFVSADKNGSAFTEVEANHQEKFNKVVVTVGDPYIALNKPAMATKFEGTGKIIDITFKVKANADADGKVSLANASYVSLAGEAIENVKIAGLHAHKSAKPATCTEPEVCAACGTEMAPALGHKPGAAATCTTAQTCTVCNAELAPVGAHKPGAAATCTAPQKCTVCSAELAPAAGHKPEAVAAVAATCTKTGLTAGEKCSVCGVATKAQDTVAALGHNWSTSWTNGSSSGHWKACKTCGEKKDYAAHSMSDGVCTVCGYGCKHSGGTATCSAQAICAKCNKPYGELLAHTPGAPATCTTAQTCTVCTAVIAEKLAHELETVEAKAATCGAIGWDKYEKCKNCDYTTYKEIAATGEHTFSDWVVDTEATTKTPGKQTHICTVCDFVESEEIPVLDAPAIPVLWIAILLLLVAAIIILIILIKKKKKG